MEKKKRRVRCGHCGELFQRDEMKWDYYGPVCKPCYEEHGSSWDDEMQAMVEEEAERGN